MLFSNASGVISNFSLPPGMTNMYEIQKFLNTRVLMLWDQCNPSTIEKYHLMASALAENGVDVTVIKICHTKAEAAAFSFLSGKNPTYKIDMGPPGPLYPGKNRLMNFWDVIKLTFILSNKLLFALRSNRNIKVIIPRESIEIALPSLIFCKLLKSTLVSNLMEYGPTLPPFSKYLRHRVCWKLIIRYSDGFIVISRFLLEQFENSKPVFYLPALIDIRSSQYKRSEHQAKKELHVDLPTDAPILLYTASPGYSDLLAFCIDSLSLIKESKFCCFITGQYNEKQKASWLKKIKARGLSNHVSFTSYLNDEDLLELERKSTAMLMPLTNKIRHRARFPQKILKYICQKKPIITTKVGEIPRFFEDNVTAFLDETVSIEGYAGKIKRALEDENTANEITKNAFRLVREKFDYRHWGCKLADFLNRLS